MASSLQELIDRLVVASDEQDVLFVLYWLNEMKEAECLVQGIHGKHSWKRYSAITSIARAPPSPHRKLILQLLLLSGLKFPSKDIVALRQWKANRMSSTPVIEMLDDWERREKAKAVYAKLLLSITVEQAAHWIDAILPPLPNAATLTGYSPLPPPPNDPYVPASILDRRFGYHIPASEAQDPLPYNYPTVESHVITSAPHSPPRPHFYYHSRSDWYHLDDSHTSHFALTSRPAHSYREYQDRLYLEPRSHNPLSVPPLVNPVNLALVRFPQRFTMQDIVDLFPKNCPPIRVLRLESSTNETYAIVQVEEDAVTTWIKCLDGIELEGRRKMRCFVTEMTGFEIEQNERQYMRPGWTSDLIRYTLPPILSRTLSIPSALSTPSTSKSTLVKKPRSSFSLSSYLHRPPRSNPVPTTVLVLNLPLNVNLRHLCRFGLTSEKHRFEQFKARGMAVAIVEFGSKTSAKRFQNRYNEGQEKKGRLAVMMESDKSVEQCIKEHFAVIDSADQGARVGDEAVFG